ncbi:MULTISPECIES: DNA polymerase III subunit gamma/tau [unclassified Minwuia]|jgi:DNA polymerase III subunit gamma/tau|uniref:DNA polymerase III subunit gamma/tau n=1 Tax=unclassified Minwuia TaxID=2618799 RepID=UPI002479B046|nr:MULTISPECIES: DNA polymerase III subunit gamma/tau [unclassified Minwuia]
MSGTNAVPYQVLARKYRPQTFDELIGQEALVRTLGNAIARNRLHHGYMLTGVRGVGKTTTARIIAKALNCRTADGPTMTPCGTCEDCRAIVDGRHIDVQELDAASRTKVEQMRELLDGVPYLPVQARTKVYIIDEVHMLSSNSFNALLKTLEEPPEHVIFIFATTEIRKVPVTVLSRCQRFDLRRVPADKLIAHLGGIAEKEGAEVDEGALQLIARAAEGSVRDSLSLLDQAIAHGAGKADTALVRDMLGLADRMRVLDLYDAVMRGQAGDALLLLRELHDAGADAQVVLQDMLEVTHWLSAERLAPGHEPPEARSGTEREKGAELAASLSMPALSRAWSLLLKGVEECRIAPAPMAAAEMTLIRLAYAADLPDPADLLRRLKDGGASAGGVQGGASAPSPSPSSGPASSASSSGSGGSGSVVAFRGSGGIAPRPQAEPEVPEPHVEIAQAPEPQQPPPPAPPEDFPALVAWVADQGQINLAGQLTHNVRLVSYRPGRLEIALTDKAQPDITNRLVRVIRKHFGSQWSVAIASESDAATLHEQDEATKRDTAERQMENPLVRAVLEVFPEARLLGIKPLVTAESDGMDADALDDESEEP